jgi:hypothetical protein
MSSYVAKAHRGLTLVKRVRLELENVREVGVLQLSLVQDEIRHGLIRIEEDAARQITSNQAIYADT